MGTTEETKEIEIRTTGQSARAKGGVQQKIDQVVGKVAKIGTKLMGKIQK